MGQNSSKALASPTKEGKKQAAPITNYNPTVDVVKKFDDPHYGEVGHVKEQLTNREMLIKRIVASTKEGYEAELAACEQRGNLSNENIVRVVGYSHEEQKNFCANHHTITVYIEYYEKTLQDKIAEACGNSLHFDETEILFLAQNLISALAYFQTHGFNHGDIRPFNVFVSADGYKLSDPTLGPQKNFTGYHAALVSGTPTFVAPEFLKKLAEKEPQVEISSKSDVFSLGATLLAVATLNNSEDLYNYDRGTIDDVLLNQRLEKVKARYSAFTYELIRDMLSLEQEKRPNFAALEARLGPHKEHIATKTALVWSTTTTHDTSDTDDILKRVAEQLAKSQALRESIEKGLPIYEPVSHHQERAGN